MKMPQFMPPPVFSEAELLDVLTGMDDTEHSPMESGADKRSPLGPSVNVVLDGDVFASEKEFAEFMESLAPEDEAGVAATSDDTMSETTSSSSPPPEGEEAAPKGKRKAVSASAPCKPTRKRRKHELDHLRAVAAELEKKLKKLSEPPSTNQPGANHFWKRVSNQMLSQRQKSVGENARLRELVREQVKAVKSLQRTLSKTPDLSGSQRRSSTLESSPLLRFPGIPTKVLLRLFESACQRPLHSSFGQGRTGSSTMEEDRTLTEVLDIFDDFLQEEHSAVGHLGASWSTPARPADSRESHDALRSGLTSSTNQEELLDGDGDDGTDGWQTLQQHGDDVDGDVGDAAEKESLDDDHTSCSSFEATAEDQKRASDEALGSARGSNRYQKRQKYELEYLKSKARELETELRRVEMESRAKMGDSMWQGVAQQQSVARQQSLGENARLKKELEEQLKLSKALERMIRKRSFFTLHANVAAEALRVDQVMATSRAAELRTDHRTMRVMSKRDPKAVSGDVLLLEVVTTRRFPFPFDAVAGVIWHFLADASNLAKMSGMDREVDDLGDALLARTTYTFPVGERSAEIKATAAFRKTVESDFVVLNWVSRGECKAKRSAKSAFEVLEKGWTKIEALPGNPGGCILRGVNHVTPTVCPSETDVDQSQSPLTDPETPDETGYAEEIGILTELIFGAYAKASGRIYAAVQNVLMEQMVHVGAKTE
ncbi:hypothetical protein BBJ28_00012371 [Nothophytophthora sp. Chile5]|nr:hypothetical protein BBJ28_00012371 [Nothophytophthora sp. Chile5]